MNVIILTPDRVGSTLLQRLVTIYMQLHEFDQPIINLHELTNGIMKYYSPVFGREVLGRELDVERFNKGGYHQTLGEITQLLRDCDHYKTSRLARYHIRNRCDSLADQLPFYEYINENFYVISARRENLLEHALSWCIYVHSRRLNVYSHQEKFQAFSDIYRRGIQVDRINLEKYLNDYKEYLEWCDRHFTVHSYFHYDKDRFRLEDYILGLDIFQSQPRRVTWQQSFDIEFNDWNRCHYLCSDISGLSAQLALPNSSAANSALTVNDVVTSLARPDQEFLYSNGIKYLQAHQHIEELVKNRVLVTGVPIKLQTLLEKQKIITNWGEVLGWYNHWVDVNGLGQHYDDPGVNHLARAEFQNYHAAETDAGLHESLHLTNDHQQG